MVKPKDAMTALFNLAVSTKSKELIWIRNLLRKQFRYDRYNNLIKICKATDQVAIHAKLMTDHQRKKYKDFHYNMNGKTYYIFNRAAAWAVGVVTEPDIYIYEIDNSV